ncbi:unnamed protein product, partial [Heterotrigona itama]
DASFTFTTTPLFADVAIKVLDVPSAHSVVVGAGATGRGLQLHEQPSSKTVLQFRLRKTSYTILKKNILWTASSEVLCGVDLKVGETYVVSGSTYTGDKANISLCGIKMAWRSVTSRQRKGFKHLYRYGCPCSIHYTPWWTKGAVLESTDGKECLWESKPGPEECQRNYGVCMPGPLGCSWVPSVPYKNCIKEYQQKREQQRAREP